MRGIRKADSPRSLIRSPMKGCEHHARLGGTEGRVFKSQIRLSQSAREEGRPCEPLIVDGGRLANELYEQRNGRIRRR